MSGITQRVDGNRLDMEKGTGDVPYLAMLAPEIKKFTELLSPNEKFEAGVKQAIDFIAFAQEQGFTAVELLGRESSERSLAALNKDVAYEAVRRIKMGEAGLTESVNIPIFIGSMSTTADIDKAIKYGADGGIMGAPNMTMAKHAMDKGFAFLPCCTLDNPSPEKGKPNVDLQQAADNIRELVSIGYRNIKFYSSGGPTVEQMQEALWRASANPAWSKVPLEDVKLWVTGGVKVKDMAEKFAPREFSAPDGAAKHALPIAALVPQSPATKLGGSEVGAAFLKAYNEKGELDRTKLTGEGSAADISQKAIAASKAVKSPSRTAEPDAGAPDQAPGKKEPGK